MKIEKKIWSKYFEEVASGKKNFELRLADWECKEGDVLVLREWNPENNSYTGRVVEKKVSYVLKTKDVEKKGMFKKEDIEKFGFMVLGLK